jgi:hypothetical protein
VPEDRLDEVAAFLNLPRSLLRPDLPDFHTSLSIDDMYRRSQPKEKA